MSGKHVLIIEDEVKIAELVRDYFVRENFEVSMLHEGSNAVETVQELRPDMVLLDLMLPGKDGLTICKEIRQFSTVPVIMVTAKVDEIDRLIGLNLGADDYICKPFSANEVVARVRSVFRRMEFMTSDSNPDTRLSYKNIVLDNECFSCEVNGEALDLTAVEFRMLAVLVSQPGRVYSREKLMQLSYKDFRIVCDRTIDSHVKNIRKKIAAVNDGEDLIHSIYGVGYKIE